MGQHLVRYFLLHRNMEGTAYIMRQPVWEPGHPCFHGSYTFLVSSDPNNFTNASSPNVTRDNGNSELVPSMCAFVFTLQQ